MFVCLRQNLENSMFGALTFFSPFCVISWDVFLKRQFGKVFQNRVTKKHIKTKINSLQRLKIMGDKESTLGGYHEYRGGQYFWIIGNPLMWAEHYSFHNLTPLFMLQILLTPPSLNLKLEDDHFYIDKAHLGVFQAVTKCGCPRYHQQWEKEFSEREKSWSQSYLIIHI